MTHAEFFKSVITLAGDNEEMVAIANSYLNSLAKKSVKAKEKRAEKQTADKPILNEMLAYLGQHEIAIASELATACGISTPKAVALGNVLLDMGRITISKVKVKGKGTLNGYSLIKEEEEEEEEIANEQPNDRIYHSAMSGIFLQLRRRLRQKKLRRIASKPMPKLDAKCL